jgi:predicted Zn-dependent protease
LRTGRRVKFKEFAMRMSRIFTPIAVALAVWGCTTNPYTGRQQLLLTDDSALQQQAVAAWQDLRAQTPISRNAALNARVQRVAQQIVSAAGVTAPVEVVVFDTDDANAFVLPGGKIGVYRGILDVATTDAQLAAILGHEFAHWQLQHAAERYSQATLAQGLYQVAGVSGQLNGTAMQALGIGLQYGVLNPYSRVQETEADKVGVDYMVRAGYNAREAITLWEKMAARNAARPPEMLSTTRIR